MIALTLTCSGTARAQEEPVVIGSQKKLPTFGLAPVHGSLNFFTQYSRDDLKPKDGDESKTTELRFEESLTLQTNAYLIHPNFLNLNLAGQFGLTQDRFDDNGRDENTNSQLYLWNVEAQFLARVRPTSRCTQTAPKTSWTAPSPRASAAPTRPTANW